MPEITEKELPPNLKSLWLKSLSAVQVSNYSYAVSIIQTILNDSPGFVEGRKILRTCEIQVAGVTKKKGLFGMSSGGAGMKLQSQAKKDPLGTLSLIEKELEKDPIFLAALNPTQKTITNDLCGTLNVLAPTTLFF